LPFSEDALPTVSDRSGAAASTSAWVSPATYLLKTEATGAHEES
jgi:hypothetical protein